MSVAVLANARLLVMNGGNKRKRREEMSKATKRVSETIANKCLKVTVALSALLCRN